MAFSSGLIFKTERFWEQTEQIVGFMTSHRIHAANHYVLRNID